MNKSILYQFYFIFCLQDINTILSQLQFDGSGYKAVVYQGIAEGFPTAKIENLKIYQDVKMDAVLLVPSSVWKRQHLRTEKSNLKPY